MLLFLSLFFFFSFQRKGLLMVLFWGPRCVCVIKLLNGFLARTRVVGCCGDAPAQLSSCYQTTKIPNYHIFTRSIRSHTFGIRLPITGGLKRCNTWVLIKNIWYIFLIRPFRKPAHRRWIIPQWCCCRFRLLPMMGWAPSFPLPHLLFHAFMCHYFRLPPSWS